MNVKAVGRQTYFRNKKKMKKSDATTDEPCLSARTTFHWQHPPSIPRCPTNSWIVFWCVIKRVVCVTLSRWSTQAPHLSCAADEIDLKRDTVLRSSALSSKNELRTRQCVKVCDFTIMFEKYNASAVNKHTKLFVLWWLKTFCFVLFS